MWQGPDRIPIATPRRQSPDCGMPTPSPRLHIDCTPSSDLSTMSVTMPQLQTISEALIDWISADRPSEWASIRSVFMITFVHHRRNALRSCEGGIGSFGKRCAWEQCSLNVLNRSARIEDTWNTRELKWGVRCIDISIFEIILDQWLCMRTSKLGTSKPTRMHCLSTPMCRRVLG